MGAGPGGAYGYPARFLRILFRAWSARLELARSAGLRSVIFVPYPLPFPADTIRCCRNVSKVLTVEMNTRQMWDDVRLSVYPDYQCRLMAVGWQYSVRDK